MHPHMKHKLSIDLIHSNELNLPNSNPHPQKEETIHMPDMSEISSASYKHLIRDKVHRPLITNDFIQQIRNHTINK